MTTPSIVLRLLAVASGTMALLLAGGCGSPPAPAPPGTAAKPGVGTPMQDVRTEANMVEMENEYIAAKNSQPIRAQQAEAMKKQQQRQVEAETAKKAKAQAEQEKQEAAKEAGK